MKKQPEALRLLRASLLAMDMKTPRQAAAELRRLHAENEDFRATCDHLTRENAEQIGEIVALKEQRDELLEALKLLIDDKHPEFIPSHKWKQARSAIAKATGETK